MSPELDGLLVWFLEFIRTGLFVYAGIAVLGALIIIVLHISEMDIGKNFLKLIPMMFFPMIFRQLIDNTMPEIYREGFNKINSFMSIFYVIPILAFILMTLKEIE